MISSPICSKPSSDLFRPCASLKYSRTSFAHLPVDSGDTPEPSDDQSGEEANSE